MLLRRNMYIINLTKPITEELAFLHFLNTSYHSRTTKSIPLPACDDSRCIHQDPLKVLDERGAPYALDTDLTSDRQQRTGHIRQPRRHSGKVLPNSPFPARPNFRRRRLTQHCRRIRASAADASKPRPQSLSLLKYILARFAPAHVAACARAEPMAQRDWTSGRRASGGERLE